ncbi:MAG TPA: hypothetical protein EYO39_10425 [Nitrospirales bacterium]|nr:hypothetical protein [Nitrospirales bacterium]
MRQRSASSTKRNFWSHLTLCGIIVLGAVVCLTGPRNAYSFVLLPPPPSQGMPLSIDLPTETFNSLGRGVTSFSLLAEGAASAWNDIGVGLSPDHAFFTKSTPRQRDPCAGIDGINTVTFSKTNCGLGWGDVLGITIRRWFEGNNVFEADVLFNDTAQWDAYSGPIQLFVTIGQVDDFTRTALHEFGHALGLGHPPGAPGQSAPAIMKSKSTDVDSLQPDDRDGAHAILYVRPTRDFRIDVTPESQTIRPGSTAEFVLSATATLQPGIQAIDLLSLTGTCPPNATCAFDSLELTNATPVTYKVTTTAATPIGQYPQRIVGIGGGVTRLTTAALTISAEVEEALARVFVTVEDDQGEPIPQARIRVKHQVTKEKIKGVSDENGEYVSPLINPADYKVICKQAGFAKVKEVITLAAGDEQTVNCILDPLAEEE